MNKKTITINNSTYEITRTFGQKKINDIIKAKLKEKIKKM